MVSRGITACKFYDRRSVVVGLLELKLQVEMSEYFDINAEYRLLSLQ